MSVPARLFKAPVSKKYILSSTIGSYLQFLGGNQELCNNLCYFGNLFDYTDQQITGKLLLPSTVIFVVMTFLILVRTFFEES